MSVRGKILVIDDEDTNLEIMEEIFDDKTQYDLRTVPDGEQGLKIIKEFQPDLVLLDIMMPGIDGYEVCRIIRKHVADEHIRVIMVSGKAMLDERLEGYEAGADDYFIKPFAEAELKAKVNIYLDLIRAERELSLLNLTLEAQVDERTRALKQLAEELKESNAKLEKAYEDSIVVLSRVVELNEGEHAGLSREVAELANHLAKYLKLEPKERQAVYNAALLVRIGYIGLPEDLANAPYLELEKEQKDTVEECPIIAETTLLPIVSMHEVAKCVRGFRERYNGMGYPDKLKGDEIPLASRIISVAYDYVILQRGMLLKERLTALESKKFLQSNANKRYDPAIVDAFVDMLKRMPTEVYQEELKLSALSLVRGMVLTRDVLSPSGTLLLPKGTRLDNDLIENIKRLERNSVGTFVVYVKDGA